MNILANALGKVPAASAYAIVAVAVLAESVLLVGAFIPTLTLLLTAGALARTGRLDLPALVTTAACAVVVGDFLAHRTGKALGDRLRTGRLGRRLPTAAWRRAEALMARHGGHAVFLARFLPILRTLTPHLAGAARLPYRRIAPYSALAAPLWATAEAGTGYTAAASLQRALSLGGPVLAATAAAGAVLAWTRVHGRTRAWTAARGHGPSRRVRPPRASAADTPPRTAHPPPATTAPPPCRSRSGTC
ncbi:DedA family protein [Streptomyces sp. Inha503]|uniref:DedA family protein n=1 Tax=Streptomyces sp. Inha503 TaxID=3383314 RepID=UPI00399F549D